MADFNPDEYLGNFDPDAYLGKPAKTVKKEEDSAIKNFIGGQFESLQRIGENTIGRLADVAGIKYHGMPISEYNKQQRDKLFQEQNIHPQSASFQTGKLAGDIELTMPVSQGVASAASKLPMAAQYAQALKTGGFDLGEAATGSKLANAAMRGVAGAGTGYLTGQLLNPESSGESAAVQGTLAAAIPFGQQLAQQAAPSMMQKSLKPILSKLQSGEAQRAINTMLNEGVNVSDKGVAALTGKIKGLNSAIEDIVNRSDKTISKQAVIDEINRLKPEWLAQGNTEEALNALSKVSKGFEAHPVLKSEEISVPFAQQMKQGTYKTIADRDWTQLGSPTTQAEQAMARGLKNEIARVHPEAAAINKKESELINALNIARRRNLMAENMNVGGLAWLASHPLSAVGALIDRNPTATSAIANALNKLSKTEVKKLGLTPAVLASQSEEE